MVRSCFQRDGKNVMIHATSNKIIDSINIYFGCQKVQTLRHLVITLAVVA